MEPVEEFKGNLRKVPLAHLISKEKVNEVDNFFLALGVIFNDLKGFLLFDILIREKYRKPEINESPSVHLGEYNGLLVQVNKLLAGLVCEFLKCLEANQDVFSTGEFNEILIRISKTKQQYWKELVTISMGKPGKDLEFTKILNMIRNNVAFHYYGSGKNLRKAFIKLFYEKDKNEYNSSAFYSIGENMENSRLYYCDAVVEEYIKESALILESNKTETIPKAFQDYMKDIISVMNPTITALIKEYLRNKPFS